MNAAVRRDVVDGFEVLVLENSSFRASWRRCYTAVLEARTNIPKDLTEAVLTGQSARLEPGAAFQTSVAVTMSALGPRD
jgi:hypothetical protein